MYKTYIFISYSYFLCVDRKRKGRPECPSHSVIREIGRSGRWRRKSGNLWNTINSSDLPHSNNSMHFFTVRTKQKTRHGAFETPQALGGCPSRIRGNCKHLKEKTSRNCCRFPGADRSALESKIKVSINHCLRQQIYLLKK